MAKDAKVTKSKKGPTAYILYSTEIRPKIMEENPEMKFGEISKKIGQLWKELSAEEKAPYVEKSKSSKAASEDAPVKKSRKAAKESSEEESDE